MNYDDYILSSPPEHSYCRYCDEDTIRDIARERAVDAAKQYNIEHTNSIEEELDADDFFDDCLETLYDEVGMCRHCAAEQLADDNDNY